MSIVAVNKSVSRESYMHKYAKLVLAQWLREVAQEAESTGSAGCCLDPICWKVDGRAPNYGIHIEWAVMDSGLGLKYPLDAWDNIPIMEKQGFSNPPSVEELRLAGYPHPKAILDVAVQDAGAIAYGIEVIHTSPVSAEKYIFLRDAAYYPFRLLEVEAVWILNQIGKPSTLKLFSSNFVGQWCYKFEHTFTNINPAVTGTWEECIKGLDRLGHKLTPSAVRSIHKAQETFLSYYVLPKVWTTYSNQKPQKYSYWSLQAEFVSCQGNNGAGA